MCNSIDSEERTFCILTFLFGTLFIGFNALYFAGLHSSSYIAEHILPNTDFSHFFAKDGSISTLYVISILLAALIAIICALIGIIRGIMGKKWGWGLFGLSVLFFFFGSLVVRLIIVLVGYLLWLFFSPIMNVINLIAMIVISILCIKEMCEKKEQIAWICIFAVDILVCSVFCVIGFVSMLGGKSEDMLVWVIRLFI